MWGCSSIYRLLLLCHQSHINMKEHFIRPHIKLFLYTLYVPLYPYNTHRLCMQQVYTPLLIKQALCPSIYIFMLVSTASQCWVTLAKVFHNRNSKSWYEISEILLLFLSESFAQYGAFGNDAEKWSRAYLKAVGTCRHPVSLAASIMQQYICLIYL